MARRRHSTLVPRLGKREPTGVEATTRTPLALADQRRLLAIARGAIQVAVCPEASSSFDESTLAPALLEPSAAFVTLHMGGRLRGCIGLMRFDVPLGINVRDAAVAAALQDPRFPPVTRAEVPTLEIEVSVLEPPIELSDPAGFEAGRHGIVVERGANRALLLPQVATEMGWGPAQMLDAVCRKAGLPGDAWRDRGTRLLVFESSCFSEATAST
ncbi:MAG TPA: AmmeMemoRadiSam system protein A [Candidatus Limnocylindrales bacterium]